MLRPRSLESCHHCLRKNKSYYYSQEIRRRTCGDDLYQSRKIFFKSRGVLVLRRVEFLHNLRKNTFATTSEQQQPQLQPSKGASSPLQCQGVTS